MGISDIFRGKEFKSEIEKLRNENATLRQQAELKLSAQQMKPSELAQLIKDRQAELSELEARIANETTDHRTRISNLNATEEQLKADAQGLQDKINSLKLELGEYDDQANMATYGLYVPRYDFATSLGYKDQLQLVRNSQKQLIKQEIAFTIFTPMTLNDSVTKGHAMQKKNGKQLIRSFNVECEAAINKVTYSNFDRIATRIQKSFDQLNKLNDPNGVRLTSDYLESKLDELHLAYEYETKKQDEKDALREQREREREEKQAQKQIQTAQKKLDKDLDHYKKAFIELQEKLATLEGTDRDAVQLSMKELQSNIEKAEADKKDLDYRQKNATAGYVYIISNVGSFGPDVVKIGVTRRLDPMERVSELGSASVPFKFDVHALIFSYDAYALEAELHQRFDSQRVNKVNNRKEYFKVPIMEIEKVLEEYKDLTIDFTEVPDAPEFRESLAIEAK
ncbi:DUF4041 domain-containing protein [Lacticaseibacillus sp. GG6-2]